MTPPLTSPSATITAQLLLLLLLLFGNTAVASAQSPAVSVTQIVAFDEGTEVDLLNVPPYGASIVALDWEEGQLTVYDLDGSQRFSIDYAVGLSNCCNNFPSYVFVDSRELKHPDRAELVVAFESDGDSSHVRAFDETETILFSKSFGRNLYYDPYLHVDTASGAGFVAISPHVGRHDSVYGYRFSDFTLGLRTLGRLGDDYPIYEGAPLLVVQEDTLGVAYAADFSVVSRIEPIFNMKELTVLSVDFRHDGQLDAIAYRHDTINGDIFTRVLVYDAKGYIYLDSTLEGRYSGLSTSAITGLRARHGGYHYLSLRLRSGSKTAEFAFRSDTGTLIEAGNTGPIFILPVCFQGEPYYLALTQNFLFTNTLYSQLDATAQEVLPNAIYYQGDSATFLTVVGSCDPSASANLSLAYTQNNPPRVLFTDADGIVQAELPFHNFAFPLRFGDAVYVYNDRADDGRFGPTIYRVGDRSSAVSQDVEPLPVVLAPNPTSGIFTLTGEASAVNELRISLYDATGKAIGASVDVYPGEAIAAPAAAGMYTVRVTDIKTGETVTKRLVVQ